MTRPPRPDTRAGAPDAVTRLQLRLMPTEVVYPFRGAWRDLLGERHNDDVVIHAIAVMNGSSEVASVASITVDATERGRLLQRVVLDKDEVEQRSAPVVARDQLGLRRLVDFILWTDQVVPPGMALSSSADLEPGHALIVPNVYLSVHRRPDRLKITVDAVIDGVPHALEADLSVVEYANRVRYGLPVEGTWLMKATPNTGVLDHHRFGVSNEFGVDFLRVGPEGEVFRASKRATTSATANGSWRRRTGGWWRSDCPRPKIRIASNRRRARRTSSSASANCGSCAPRSTATWRGGRRGTPS